MPDNRDRQPVPRGEKPLHPSNDLVSFNFSPGRYPLQFAHDHIHHVCHDGGIPYLDLLPAFQETSSDRMQAIPGIDPHPSEIAHRIAAEAIVAYLLEEGHISDGYRPEERSSEVPLHAIWRKTIERFDCTRTDSPGALKRMHLNPSTEDTGRNETH